METAVSWSLHPWPVTSIFWRLIYDVHSCTASCPLQPEGLTGAPTTLSKAFAWDLQRSLPTRRTAHSVHSVVQKRQQRKNRNIHFQKQSKLL